MKFSIIIPNYNGQELLKKNLPRVLAASDAAEVIVVDDASTDESIKVLEADFPEVRLIKKRKNTGFAQTCNKGVKKAKGDIIVLLNTDAYPEEDFLKPLKPHFHEKQVFAVGCLEITGNQTRGKAIGKFEKGFLVHQEASDRKPGITLWAFGASAAFDRKKWLEIGGMDYLFKPAYWEDIDLSWRAWKRGWNVRFEPESKVYHDEESTNIKVFGKQRMKNISYKNQILFVWKNIHDPYLLLKHLFWFPWLLASAAFRRDKAFFLGFLKALLQFPEAIKVRRLAKNQSLKSDVAILKIFQSE